MAKIGTKEMTSGPLLLPIFRYTLPIIATGALQLLFNTADLIVVGWFCGETSVGSVGATGALNSLIINLFMGLSVGAGVEVAQALGSRNKQRVHQTVHTAIPVAIICGVIVTVIGVTFCGKFLEWMDTPEENLKLATLYMRIYFSGMVFTLLLNFGAAILRAAGDTMRPMLYLTLAGVVNVVLNVIFVTLFHMDVAGVALATVISQAVSAILILRALMKREDACKLKLREMSIHRKPLFRMIAIGVPAGIQSSLFAISNVLIQSSINSFGSVALAGSTAAANLEGYLYIVMNSFNQTVMNFAGQNTGAHNYKRIGKLYWVCLLMTTIIGFVLGGLVCLFAKPLLCLYGADSAEALHTGTVRLICICLPYFLCGILEVATGAVRGMGISLSPMIVTVLGVCGLRILWLFTLFAKHHSLEWLFVSYPISWAVTFLAISGIFFSVLHFRKKQFKKETIYSKEQL
ncbi:MAG: MATE family efflux transporter [Clostridia bacterium]|nr:MATE family efflux transporter [Clostridia bacterium]